MNPSFWQNKRVLVTGHTGFKGSWLCLLLNSFGARVRRVCARAAHAAQPLLARARPRARRVDYGRHPRSGWDRRRRAVVRSGIRDSHGRAVGGPALLRRPCRDLFDERPRDGQCSGGRSTHSPAVRRDQCHHRQVLREQGLGLGLPRKRRARRARSVLEQQGVCGTRGPVVPGFVLSVTTARRARRRNCQRPGGQRHRWGGLDAATVDSRHHCSILEIAGDRASPSRGNPPMAARAGLPRRISEARGGAVWRYSGVLRAPGILVRSTRSRVLCPT